MTDSICKSIYIQSGFLGVISVLNNLPSRLQDEIMEDISLNMIEWENKMTIEEKNELRKDISSQAEFIASKDKLIIDEYKEGINPLLKNIERLEKDRILLLEHIIQFPSILPENDIESITDIDLAIDENKNRIQSIEERIKELLNKEDKKESRKKDSLFVL